ncbi:16S rRNA (cytosine(1402)-N(4))-methyltransferase RsmH [Candidatus Parcubacteria bacterium]|nr:MAG: 16S rRNA (cytosine(1402)-N(4))-methyltransferase RsmH [Candidatus Parcubacteria bacterium]
MIWEFKVMTSDYHHISVLGDEVIKYLQPQAGQNFIDCTLGGGGHTERILEETGPKGRVLAFELDQRAVEASRLRLKKYQNRLIIIQDSYVHLKEIAKRKDFKPIQGIVFDLGLSSDQLDRADRGFSFKDHGSLDMRFDEKSQTLKAEDIVLYWSKDDLLKIFREYGEVKQVERVAQGIVAWRETFLKQKQKKLKTSMFVSAILGILNIKESSLKRFRIHPATQIFQALRIAVNSELDNISKALPQAFDILEPGGRIAVISFHSLEDRIVKQYFKQMSLDCICPPESPICNCGNKPKVKIITKKSIKPSAQEISTNWRSRSAKLRVVEKIS